MTFFCQWDTSHFFHCRIETFPNIFYPKLPRDETEGEATKLVKAKTEI